MAPSCVEPTSGADRLQTFYSRCCKSDLQRNQSAGAPLSSTAAELVEFIHSASTETGRP
jgi:hypothetical protein